jgi:DNA replication protein DnaC
MIRRAHRAEILFIDDIGKEKYTERVESEFYDLIETRTAHLRPILWTANTSGAGLEAMMSPDRGAPILRRLREFTEIITL